jgi:4-carboxymuconolactone decarboxylase
MTDSQAQTPAQRAIGDFAPKLVSLTDDVLFGDVWERPELSKRDRSLVTVAALVTNGSTEQLRPHLVRAKDNGLTESELKEAIIHLAFYAGWPRAMSAITVAKGDLRRLMPTYADCRREVARRSSVTKPTVNSCPIRFAAW